MTIQDIKDQNLLLFECISGSKAYNLNTPTSDTDIKGVYFLAKEQFYGLDYIPQISNETNDEVYYELGRFVDLLLKNNPNILEILASPASCILYKHPIMNQLSIEMFLSKLCKETFAGYGITQIKKAKGLNKKMVNPLPKERKTVLDFCYAIEGAKSIPIQDWLAKQQLVQEKCGLVNLPHAKGVYALYYDEIGNLNYKGIIKHAFSNDISLSSVPKEATEKTFMYANIEAYSMYCKSYKEYWDWVENRNEARYQGNMQHGKDYDTKNMMHTIRLLQVADEILKTQKLNVRRENRTQLLAIKSGDFEYEELIKMANELIESIEKAYETTALPDIPDKDNVVKILVGMRKELYV